MKASILSFFLLFWLPVWSSLEIARMEPLYEISGSDFEEHIVRLRGCARVVENAGFLYPLLFISGLRLAVHCWEDSQKSFGATKIAPQHALDDGLDCAAAACLKTLIRLRSSRDVRDLLVLRGGKPPFSPWFELLFAFLFLFERPPRTFANWLEAGDVEVNRLRITCAMGIVSLLRSPSSTFVFEIIKEPPPLTAEEVTAMAPFTFRKLKAV